MRTITKRVKLYRFTELSEESRQKAKDDYAQGLGYDRGQELLESLKKLAEHFLGRLTNWSISWDGSSYSSVEFEMPYVHRPDEDVLNLLGDGPTHGGDADYGEITLDDLIAKIAALGSYNPETLQGNGDCVLTGFCWDEDAIDGLRRLYLTEGCTDLDKLMQAAFRSLLKAGEADCEDFYSDETFGEHSDANDWEYLKDSSLA